MTALDLLDTLKVRDEAVSALAEFKKQIAVHNQWMIDKNGAEPPAPRDKPDVDAPTAHANELATKLAEEANKVGDRVLAGYANKLRVSISDTDAATGVKLQCGL